MFVGVCVGLFDKLCVGSGVSPGVLVIVGVKEFVGVNVGV